MLNPSRNSRGFTLFELVTTLVIFAALVTMAIPNFSRWIANSQVRSVSEALQNGLRLAEAESVRRNRRIQFSLTNGTPSTLPATAINGSNWMIVTVPLITSSTGTLEPAEMVEGGQFNSVASNVQITTLDSSASPASFATVTFSPLGRPVPNLGPTYPVTFKVSISRGDRPLDVLLSAGGEVRLCDPSQANTSLSLGC